MTDSFVSYSEDFEQFRDDAAQDIRALSDATSKGAVARFFASLFGLFAAFPLELTPAVAHAASREELAERALGNISEAERYVRGLRRGRRRPVD